LSQNFEIQSLVSGQDGKESVRVWNRTSERTMPGLKEYGRSLYSSSVSPSKSRVREENFDSLRFFLWRSQVSSTGHRTLKPKLSFSCIQRRERRSRPKSSADLFIEKRSRLFSPSSSYSLSPPSLRSSLYNPPDVSVDSTAPLLVFY
jgi:hypothetical protein